MKKDKIEHTRTPQFTVSVIYCIMYAPYQVYTISVRHRISHILYQ